MTYIDKDIIEKIRISNDIVDVIGSYIPLTEKGKNQFCVCPFHDDHNPSMSISREKQIFTCFVCGESGNVFTFLMKYLNITFEEAAKILGENCNIKITTNEKKKTDEYEIYYKINETASLYFKNNLKSKEGLEARKYLENRNLSKKVIDDFDIGLSLNNSLYNTLSKKYEPSLINEIDLMNNSYDSFINRIMFPIRNHEGNIVGFTGRIYKENDKSESKYKNTKETKIFKKGKIFYNYFQAKESIRKKKEVIICEGNMDTIRIHSIGILNSIAIMGSNMTREQIEFIKNLKVNVVLNLDQDEAGKLGTYNIGEELLKLKINPKVIIFNKEKDSDDLISKHGKEEFESAYRNKIDFIDFKLDYLKKNKNLNNSIDLSKYINDALISINELDDNILREIKINELSKKYNIDKSILMNKITNNSVKIIKKEVIKKPRLDKYKISEMRIIYLMLNYPEVINIYEKKLGYLINDNMKELANEIISYKIINKGFDYSGFLSTIVDNERENNTLKEIIAYNHFEKYTDEELDDYINIIKLYSVNCELKKLEERIKNSIDISEKKELLKKIENMKKDVLEW